MLWNTLGNLKVSIIIFPHDSNGQLKIQLQILRMESSSYKCFYFRGSLNFGLTWEKICFFEREVFFSAYVSEYMKQPYHTSKFLKLKKNLNLKFLKSQKLKNLNLKSQAVTGQHLALDQRFCGFCFVYFHTFELKGRICI